MAQMDPSVTNMSALASYGPKGDNIELLGYLQNWRFMACCGLEGVRAKPVREQDVNASGTNPQPVPRSLYPGFTSFMLHFGHICRAFAPSEVIERRVEQRLVQILSGTMFSSDLDMAEGYGKFSLPSTLVCLHVRRGDYTRVPNYHRLLEMEWYTRAIHLVAQRLQTSVETLHFYVFSDDISWCRAQHPLNSLPKVTFVDPQPNSLHSQSGAWVEMLVMAQFRSRIMGASTFSWWSAFLSNCKADGYSKTVVMPSKFFHSSQTGLNTASLAGLVMPDWLVLSPSD